MSKKHLLILQYLGATIAIEMVLAFVVALLGVWLRVRVPAVVTIGLSMGVIAWFANKLHKSMKRDV